jgi:hypothetical protein
VAAAGEDIVRDRAAAGWIENGLVSTQTAERARRRPPKEEAGAKASAPDDSAATSTSRGLHIVAIQSAVRVGSNGFVAAHSFFFFCTAKQMAAAASAQAAKTVWNPFTARDKCSRQHTREALKRIKSDIKQLVKAPLPGIIVWVDEKDMSMVHLLVNGPFDTPYEGGFFYFLAWCPPEYPCEPPKVIIYHTYPPTHPHSHTHVMLMTIPTHPPTHPPTHTHTHAHAHAHAHALARTHIHTHTHTHTHTPHTYLYRSRERIIRQT